MLNLSENNKMQSKMKTKKKMVMKLSKFLIRNQV